MNIYIYIYVCVYIYIEHILAYIYKHINAYTDMHIHILNIVNMIRKRRGKKVPNTIHTQDYDL